MSAYSREFFSTSGLFSITKDAYYIDCFAIKATALDVPIEEIYARLLSTTPKWFDVLVTIRNKVIKFVGLKSTADIELSTTPFEVARKKFNMQTRSKPNKVMDFFMVEQLSKSEIIVGISDSHLDLKVSILRTNIDETNGTCTIAASHVIHTHNFLGKFYLFFILPVHKFIVKRMLNEAKYRGDI